MRAQLDYWEGRYAAAVRPEGARTACAQREQILTDDFGLLILFLRSRRRRARANTYAGLGNLAQDKSKEEQAARSKLVNEMKVIITSESSKYHSARNNKIDCVDNR